MIAILALCFTVAVAFFAAWIFYRGGGGTAIASLEAAGRVMEKRIQALEAQLRALEAQAKIDAGTIAELRRSRDLTAALKPIEEWTVHHEARAQERHENMLPILQLIADRLGPDPVNGSTN